MEKFSLPRQLLVCAVMSLLALGILRFVQHAELPAALLAGLPWRQQLALGFALGLVAGGASVVSSLRKPDDATVRRTADSYGRLDLRGLNPLWIALAAGIGEELLFRAALQPLLGIWLSSLLFVAMHSAAYDFSRLDRTALTQAAGVLGMSLVFGLVFAQGGLLTAMTAHTVIDICGLYAVRRVVEIHRAGTS